MMQRIYHVEEKYPYLKAQNDVFRANKELIEDAGIDFYDALMADCRSDIFGCPRCAAGKLLKNSQKSIDQ